MMRQILSFMAAAVADFTPQNVQTSKIKKTKVDGDLSIQLERTTDILASLGNQKADGQILVGFALETDDGIENSRDKLSRKNLDMIVLNNPSEEGAGFGTTTNRVDIISASGGGRKFAGTRQARSCISHPRSRYCIAG